MPAHYIGNVITDTVISATGVGWFFAIMDSPYVDPVGKIAAFAFAISGLSLACYRAYALWDDRRKNKQSKGL